MQVIARGGSHQATVTHKGQRYRRQFSALSEAQAWSLEAKARLLRGDHPDMGERASVNVGKPRTLRELLDWTHERHWRGQRAEAKTIMNAEGVIRIIGPTLPIHKCDAFAIDKLVVALRKGGNANATVNRKLAALSRMLSVALDLDLIAKKPKIERFKETEKRSFRFTQEIERQAMELYHRTGANWMMGFIMLSLDTGLRVGEVLKLRWSDVAETSLVAYETKGGKNRTVPLSTRLKSHLALHHRRAGLVFEGVTQNSITAQWRKLREVLSLEDEKSFVPHILRHEFCSRLADRGVAAQAIQQLAGHSSMNVTQRYINLSALSLEAAIKSLETTT